MLAVLFNVPPALRQTLFRWAMVSGQASLFFYVAHIVLYRLPSTAAVMWVPLPGIVRGYLVWVAGLALLIPLSKWYRGMRKRYPRSILRYL